jgi:dTDP-4-amino-4,6-dideoxygalactose transaminase
MSAVTFPVSGPQALTIELRTTVPTKIPFNKPFITGREIEYITSAISNSGIAADGHFTRRCAELLAIAFNTQSADDFIVHRGVGWPRCSAI